MVIMGLALIVILMSLGILFVIRFVVMKPKSEVRDSYTQTQTAQNILSAIMKTSTQCKSTVSYTVSDLLKSCARGQNIICSDGNNSCEYVNNTIEYILNETLVVWSMKFNFTAFANGKYISLIEFGNATSFDKEAKVIPLPLYPQPGSLIIRLELFK